MVRSKLLKKLVRLFIIVGASLSEQCIAVMAHKPLTTTEFVTVCCSMSVVSNAAISSVNEATEAFTKLHTEVMR